MNPPEETPLTWNEFTHVEMRVGTIISTEEFKEARNPAYKMTIDFGDYGLKKTSAQITILYNTEELIGKQVVAVINFPPKQIGKIMSEVLITGFPDKNGQVILCTPDKRTPNGAKLY